LLNGIQIIFLDSEAKYVDVVSDVIEIGRARQHYNVLLHKPLENYLRGCAMIFLSKILNNAVINRRFAQTTVSHELNLVLATKAQYFAVLRDRVVVILNHVRFYFSKVLAIKC
jgi:hypothetical protein